MTRLALALALGVCACDPVADAIVGSEDSSGGVDETSGGYEPDPSSDEDGDGIARSDDCNDHHAAVFPGAPEVFDGFDNDCDGEIDEDGADEPSFEGYGESVRGGAGGEVVRVTTLEDAGPGSLREALQAGSGPIVIEFDVAGEIVLQSNVSIRRPFVTIHGASAPAPGITVVLPSPDLSFEVQGTHDVIVTHLRFVGSHVPGQPPASNEPAFGIDADSAPDNVASGVVFDHLTVLNTPGGGPDLWGEIRDVTVSYCLVANSRSGTTATYFGPEPLYTLQRISFHHNAWIGNDVHNPQFRADVRDLDFVNNVVADWGDEVAEGVGLLIRAKEDEPSVSANVVGNHFSADTRREWAIVYGDVPGASDGDGGPQTPAPPGAVVPSAALGSLWLADNRVPSETVDQYSTVTEPNPVPDEARMQRFAVETLAEATLAWVGTRDRTDDEQARLDAVAARF